MFTLFLPLYCNVGPSVPPVVSISFVDNMAHAWALKSERHSFIVYKQVDLEPVIMNTLSFDFLVYLMEYLGGL
jgi:hypothetical protein